MPRKAAAFRIMQSVDKLSDEYYSFKSLCLGDSLKSQYCLPCSSLYLMVGKRKQLLPPQSTEHMVGLSRTGLLSSSHTCPHPKDAV